LLYYTLYACLDFLKKTLLNTIYITVLLIFWSVIMSFEEKFISAQEAKTTFPETGIFHRALIPGVLICPLKIYQDARGWLFENYRQNVGDKINFNLLQSYTSVTLPGITRGPHEHVEQTDYFIFFSGTGVLHLWQKIEDYRWPVHLAMEVGENNPVMVIVPPGVVHAYKNVGKTNFTIINHTDVYYGGPDGKGKVDEIRHEKKENNPYFL